MIQSADRAEILLAAWANRGLTIHRMPNTGMPVRVREEDDGQKVNCAPYARVYRKGHFVAQIDYEWYPEREDPE